METLDTLFRDYLKDCIMPFDKAVTRAIKAHSDLRTDLEADEKFGKFIVRTLLSGSYGRDTAIRAIKDVDIVVQLDLSLADLQSLAKQDETAQECLLRLLQEAILRTGRAARTRKARRSVHVTLPEEINEIGEDLPELTLDIVPVLLQLDKDTDPMLIADKDLVGWYDTYPITQLKDSERRNGASTELNGYRSYKSLVKIMKAWKVVHFGGAKTPKGFILECLTATYHNPKADHWIDTVHDLFQNICLQWPSPELLATIPLVHDISNQNPTFIPIAKTIDDAKRVLEKMHKHLALIEQAMEEAETNTYKSAKTLQRVFWIRSRNNLFPPSKRRKEQFSYPRSFRRVPMTFTKQSPLDDHAIEEHLSEFRTWLLDAGFHTLHDLKIETWQGPVYVEWVDPDSGIWNSFEHKVDIRFNDGFPYRNPSIILLDPLPLKKSFHLFSDNSMCLWQEPNGWAPFTAAQSLIARVQEWLTYYHTDSWPADSLSP